MPFKTTLDSSLPVTIRVSAAGANTDPISLTLYFLSPGRIVDLQGFLVPPGAINQRIDVLFPHKTDRLVLDISPPFSVASGEGTGVIEVFQGGFELSEDQISDDMHFEYAVV